jgi:HlyD family secretion protein/adhesin transport system membrane fusion protein
MKRTSENQIRHLSQAVQLEEAVSPTIIRTTMMTIGITIIAFTVWAGFTNINEVARAPGEIVPSGYQQVVQHLEGGLVRKIDVAEGDMVEKGQELVLLDGAGFAEDLERARSKQLALSLQEERLRAYLEKRDPDFSQFKVSDEAALRDQQNFFKSMEVSNAEERKIVQEQIVQKRRVIGSLQSELKTAEGNRDISQKLFSSRQELYGKGFLSETKFLEAQQALNSINGEISQIKSRLSVAQAEISEYQNRLNSLGLTQNDEINMRLDSILVEKAQNEEVLRKLEERFARLAIRAPVSGIVKGLAVNTIGAIVRPGETLMEIVPVDHEMVVQVKIEPQHVGHIKIGQPVKVKLSSFDFARYGLVNGNLEQISATTFSGENGSRYYQGRVKLEHNYVGRDARNIVMPGMTAMAEIITGEKTILQYLLKPIHNSLKTAFSER